MYKLTIHPSVVYNVSQDTFIPFDNNNTDYQKYLEWLDEGNEPEVVE